jgi:hypothetical protein
MVGRQDIFHDLEGAPKRWLGLGWTAGIAVEHGQVVQAVGEAGMSAASSSLVDGDRALAEQLGFSTAAGLTVDHAHVLERVDEKVMPWDEVSLVDGDRALAERLGLGEAAGLAVERG